jgi:hypothetical protein
MPYVVQYDVPGDEQLYQRIKEAIGAEQPAGLLVHLVVKAPGGGLRHVGVWESSADFQQFDRDRVGPAVAGVLRSIGVSDAGPAPTHQELDLVDLQVSA